MIAAIFAAALAVVAVDLYRHRTALVACRVCLDRVPEQHLDMHMATNHDPSETREDHHQ